DLNVPRFFRRPVLGSILREYSRYSPDFSLRIIPSPRSARFGTRGALARGDLDLGGILELSALGSQLSVLSSQLRARYAGRSESGTHVRPRGPVYSESGRMMRFAWRCSKACAIQPLTRPIAKVGVKSETSRPSPCRRRAV